LALPGTFLTRGVRQQEAPHCKTFRVELTMPLWFQSNRAWSCHHTPADRDQLRHLGSE
jgi:hypothetical protein